MNYLERVLKLGVKLWHLSRDIPEELRVDAYRDQVYSLPGQLNVDEATNIINTMVVCQAWVDAACRGYVVDSKCAAAWASTNIENIVGDVRLPASCFYVRIFGDVILKGTRGEVYKYCWVCTAKHGNGKLLVIILSDGEMAGATTVTVTMTIEEFLSHGIDYRAPRSLLGGLRETDEHLVRAAEKLLCDPEQSVLSDEAASSVERLMLAVRRIIIGALLQAQHGRNEQDKTNLSNCLSKRELKGLPPPHRAIILGRDLKIGYDARQAVRDWVQMDKGMPLAFQHIVRGHYKRQAHGPGGLQRKVLWVQPYWRGPEDAPIVAKAYALKGEPDVEGLASKPVV